MKMTSNIIITDLKWSEDAGSFYAEFVGITYRITEHADGAHELALLGISDDGEHYFVEGHFPSLERAKAYVLQHANDCLSDTLHNLCTYSIRNKTQLTITVKDAHHE